MTGHASVCTMAFAVACAAMMLSSVVAADEPYLLEVNEGDTSIEIVSGNLTASLTYAWPNAIFWHSLDPWSPHFDVSFPKMYLFSDANEDNYFVRSEANYTAYLDELHYMSWNISAPPYVGYDPVRGQYAQMGMWGNVSLFSPADDDLTILVRDWAFVSFWFWISENATTYSNSYGEYSAFGRVEVRVNITLKVLNQVNATGIAMEQELRGGGETNMFHIKQASKDSPFETVEVPARVDETVLGTDFGHVLANTDMPMQELAFAKDDGTLQAQLRWNSESSVSLENISSAADSMSTYYTTGTGLVLHSVLELPDVNGTVTRDCIVGLIEEGFAGTMQDWVKENIVPLTALTVLMVGATVLTVWFSRLHKRHGQRLESKEPEERDDKGVL